MAKKYLHPKTWYLVAAGAAAGTAAVAAAGARRLMRRRKAGAEVVEVRPAAPATAAPQVETATRATKTEPAKPAAEAQQPAAKPETAKAPAAAAPAKDDLTDIKGIGPVFARRLAEAGITTFAELAQASPDHLRQVTQATATANPEEWIAQARDL